MKRAFMVALCCLVACGLGLAQAFAAEVTFPTFSYEGQELAKVREWEKTWAGKKITTENVDQVKDFLQEAVYKYMKAPASFGAESLWFEIVPYRPYQVSKGMIAATQKYAPSAKLDEKQQLVGYGDVAGIPFPQPKTGAEMAWNFDGNTHGDARHDFATGSVVDCRTKNERAAGMLRWELYWIGRYDLSPIPKIPDKKNRKGIARSFFQRHTAPVDFIDTTMLEIKYKNIFRNEDLWVRTAMFRRIRRYASSQRSDTIDGTDMIYDDHDGWYTHLRHNTYKYLGRADLLVCRHQEMDKLQRIKGQGIWSGLQRERANQWVVEVKNEDKDYIYSRQIWYLDPETWQMNFKIMYNRQGELWKMMEMPYHEVPSSGGEKTSIVNGDNIIDFIRRHGSPGKREDRGTGIEIPLEKFQVKSLKVKTY